MARRGKQKMGKPHHTMNDHVSARWRAAYPGWLGEPPHVHGGKVTVSGTFALDQLRTLVKIVEEELGMFALVEMTREKR